MPTNTKYNLDTSVLTNKADFDFMIVSEKDMQEVLLVLRKSFFNLELLHNMLKAMDNPACIRELEQLVLETMKDGVSVVAKDQSNGKIVSVATCKIQEKPEKGQLGAFDTIAAAFKEPESLGIMEFMIKVDGKVDMYAKYNTNTIFEIMFLGTLPEYCGRRLAKDVCTAALQLAEQVGAGAVSILPSSPWTERISKSLGFELLHEADYSEFVTKDGVKYSDLVGKEKTYTLRALQLKPKATKK